MEKKKVKSPNKCFVSRSHEAFIMQFVYQGAVDDLYGLFSNQWDTAMRLSIPISTDPMCNQHRGRLGCTFKLAKRTQCAHVLPLAICSGKLNCFKNSCSSRNRRCMMNICNVSCVFLRLEKLLQQPFLRKKHISTD